ncbi:hypothetical protein Tco_0940026 [Tanacetum coccineum]|uniref:Uncharacterized protein n=1 Tax=Tanacetum coccineum TaxID=301880 RepID=A0ABQ5DLS1_9ASTR
MEVHCVALELKYQNLALKSGQHGQFLKAKSNEATIRKDIDDFETINIELEYRVATLLKENEHLKKTYKDLYDSIKKTQVQTKEQIDSLIAQLIKKSIENADLKVQIQEKVFANAALKNKLRKLKGNSVDTKWVPTGTIFTSSTTKVDSEPPHGSNTDITNPHECKQTLDLSAGTSINVQKDYTLNFSARTPIDREKIKALITENMIVRRPSS